MSSRNNVVTTEGKQVIEIDAKGGYSPRTTSAKAGVPTVLKVKTSGTFDCSSSLVIPSISYRKNLPPSGETLIDLPPQEVGYVLRGTCSMGMYNFEVVFS
jgi:plastocyanin domain-containing protein